MNQKDDKYALEPPCILYPVFFVINYDDGTANVFFSACLGFLCAPMLSESAAH